VHQRILQKSCCKISQTKLQVTDENCQTFTHAICLLEIYLCNLSHRSKPLANSKDLHFITFLSKEGLLLPLDGMDKSAWLCIL